MAAIRSIERAKLAEAAAVWDSEQRQRMFEERRAKSLKQMVLNRRVLAQRRVPLLTVRVTDPEPDPVTTYTPEPRRQRGKGEYVLAGDRCDRGHLWADHAVYLTQGKRAGKRLCGLCRRERATRYRAAQRVTSGDRGLDLRRRLG